MRLFRWIRRFFAGTNPRPCVMCRRPTDEPGEPPACSRCLVKWRS